MRNFKIRKRTKPIFISKTAFVNVTLLAGIAIFVALAALTGKLVSNNVLPNTDTGTGPTPDDGNIVVSQPTPGIDGSTDSTFDENGTVISIDSKDYYFVQFGVFSTMENAQTCADSIASMGGAGYIRQQDGRYYVFAMCYSNGDDAKTVVANLKAQGYSTLLKCFSHRGMIMNLSGSEAGINQIETAYNGIISANTVLEDIIYKFDKKEIDRIELKNQLRTLLGSIEIYRDIFSTYSEQSSVFADAQTLCSDMYTNISDILKLENDTELTSKTKNVYISNVFNLIQYLDNVVVG